MVRVTAKPFVAGAFAMLLASTMLTPVAHADDGDGDIKLVWVEHEDDGSDTQLWQKSNGRFFIIMVWKDGYRFVYDPGDPNPDDTESGKGSHSDKPDVVGMIKSGEARVRLHLAPDQSAALMNHLRGALGDGGGLGPRYNPSDDDNGSGPGQAPDHSMEVKKTPQEIRAEIEAANEIASERAALESAMGDGDEGSGEGPTGFNKNGPGTGDDDGDYTEGQNKTVGNTEKDLLGAKPEFVNPPHWGNDLGSHADGASSMGGGAGKGGSVGGGAAHSAAGAADGRSSMGGGAGKGGGSLGGGAAHSATGAHG